MGTWKEWQPDTDLEVLFDIYTPFVPKDANGVPDPEYSHINKDIVLSQFKDRHINFINNNQELVSVLIFLFGVDDESVKIAKMQLATFAVSRRAFDGFERKQQTTSVNIHKITASGSGAKDKIQQIVGGGRRA